MAMEAETQMVVVAIATKIVVVIEMAAQMEGVVAKASSL